MSGKAWLAIGFALLGVAVTYHDEVWFWVLTSQTPIRAPLLLTHWDGPILAVLGVFILFWAMTTD